MKADRPQIKSKYEKNYGSIAFLICVRLRKSAAKLVFAGEAFGEEE